MGPLDANHPYAVVIAVSDEDVAVAIDACATAAFEVSGNSHGVSVFIERYRIPEIIPEPWVTRLDIGLL